MNDFKRILKEPDNSLIKQYKALLKTENVDLDFTDDGIDTIANLATEVNSTVENIGARRLHTIIERVFDEISFTATDNSGKTITVNSEYVKKNLGELVKDTDLIKIYPLKAFKYIIKATRSTFIFICNLISFIIFIKSELDLINSGTECFKILKSLET